MKTSHPLASLPVSELVGHILPEFDDPPCNQRIQSRLLAFWRDEAGIIAPHSHPLIFESGRLVIFCDSPVWSTQIRHQTPSLLKQVRNQGFNISKVTVKTIPKTQALKSGKNAYRNSISISSENAAALQQTSNRIKHRGLKESLLKLAGKTRSE